MPIMRPRLRFRPRRMFAVSPLWSHHQPYRVTSETSSNNTSSGLPNACASLGRISGGGSQPPSTALICSWLSPTNSPNCACVSSSSMRATLNFILVIRACDTTATAHTVKPFLFMTVSSLLMRPRQTKGRLISVTRHDARSGRAPPSGGFSQISRPTCYPWVGMTFSSRVARASSRLVL